MTRPWLVRNEEEGREPFLLLSLPSCNRYLRKTQRRKGFLANSSRGFQAGSWLCCFWACGQAARNSRKQGRSKDGHLMVAGKDRVRRRGARDKVESLRTYTVQLGLSPPNRPLNCGSSAGHSSNEVRAPTTTGS